MKTCFECEAEVPDEAEFCHNCGRRVTNKHPQEGEALAKRTSGSGPELLAKSKAEHVAIRSRILTTARAKASKAITFLVVSSVALALVCLATPDSLSLGHLVAAYAITIIFSKLMGRDRWLTQNEYYSITGSRDHNGEHRCIFCSNKGIYRQGEYAGNTTYARCSKCQEPLFFH